MLEKQKQGAFLYYIFFFPYCTKKILFRSTMRNWHKFSKSSHNGVILLCNLKPNLCFHANVLFIFSYLIVIRFAYTILNYILPVDMRLLAKAHSKSADDFVVTRTSGVEQMFADLMAFSICIQISTHIALGRLAEFRPPYA